VIEASGLSKRYGDLVAVRDVSFRIERGEVVGFLGPNGAGKTTTMRMLTGFLPPSEGTVSVAGHDMLEDPIEARRAIGYLPETPPLYPEMRVDDYLRYVAAIKDVARAARGERIEKALASCGLADVRRRVIRTLSKGYRQRVGLAQAIVHEPQVLVLDEPTSGLDPVQIVEIRRLIKALAEVEGRTVILSTHILPEVEAICRRVILISQGRIRVDGALDAVRGTGTLEDVFLREAAPPEAAAPEAAQP
jgi:ABC-2 type transport system ATP-binding protein